MEDENYLDRDRTMPKNFKELMQKLIKEGEKI